VSPTAPTTLDAGNPAAWAQLPFDELLSLPLAEVQGPQREAVARRFAALRPGVASLDKLATQQGVDRFDTVEDALPLFFDHRVYKSYPLGLIEKRQFGRLTAWLDRLTTHSLTSIPLDGVTSVDSWLDRLDEHGMIVGHSTGTTGKLSFIPRSQTEWPAWQAAYFRALSASIGVDTRELQLPNIAVSGYRSGHQMMTKMGKLFGRSEAGGRENRHLLYDYKLSSDLLSLAARMQAAEERGELDDLEFDPALLEERKALIEASQHREEDSVRWFAKQADEFRGQRVRLGGTSADLVRLAVAGREAGIVCKFASGSILMFGGGMKGYRDAPSDWEEVVKEFFGIDRLCSMYSMSECMGLAPLCTAGYFHFPPYMVPVVLDEDANPLPAAGTHTGRMTLFDLLAETYWGGFISGDQVTIYWDEDCACGWMGPRIDRTVVRFGELEGGDDKITCAGTAQAYNNFMDYVSGG
jgi:hypothetical protein